jgi:tripartite-type tricarboxylate transporter receptor subunit TctC
MTRASRSSVSFLLAAFIGCVLLVQPSSAQFPNRLVRVISPYAPGGGTDLLARVIAPRLQDALGQKVIVENRSGGSGMVAGVAVVNSPPDGSTLLIDTASVAVNASLMREPSYNAATQLEPVAMLTTLPFVFTSRPGPTEFKTFAEFAEAARREPGKVTVAIGGTSNRLVVKMFQLAAGVDVIIVPYRGSALALGGLIAGDISAMVSDLPTAAGAIADRRVRALAVTTAERTQYLPEATTMREAGFPDVTIGQWFGLFAPVGTPPGALDRLNTEINKILSSREIQEYVAKIMFADTAAMSRGEFATFYRGELGRYKDLLTRANIPQE